MSENPLLHAGFTLQVEFCLKKLKYFEALLNIFAVSRLYETEES